MKKQKLNFSLLVAASLLALSACKTAPMGKGRNPATFTDAPAVPVETVQQAIDLSVGGSRIGKADYRLFHPGLNHPAIRLYMKKVDGEQNAYWGVLLEYVNIPGILPQYLNGRMPEEIRMKAAKVIGYLNHITKLIALYKVTPTADQRAYEMHPVKLQNGEVVANMAKPALHLTLAESIDITDPLGGATIAKNGPDDPKISFPVNKSKIGLSQFNLANVAYDGAKLQSTWRANFLYGGFLSAYGKIRDVSDGHGGLTPSHGKADLDVVLKFEKDGQGDIARFFIEDQYRNLSAKDQEKRVKVFTSPKSATLEGSFRAKKNAPGVFTFTPMGGKVVGGEDFSQRIGLFIDVFDARESLNQDVVEVAFINPEDPMDLMMYYEHPDNHDGGGARD